jgi:hypothetical protein
MKTLVKMESPVTQTVEAVQQLIAYFNHGQQPEEMPSFYRLSGELVLAQSKKGDAYYVTTPHSCSCPAATYNPGKPCKHSRKYFPQPNREVASTVDLRAALPGWRGPDGQRANGPVEAI